MVMVNLMIAVILEAFSDSSSNDLIEVIETCIRVWPQYDSDLLLKVSMRDVFRFENTVATEHGVDLMKHDDDKDPRHRRLKQDKGSGSFLSRSSSEGEEQAFDMSEVPMRIAKLCEVKVLPDGSVHFLFAVRMAVAVTLSGNVTEVLKEFEEAESKAERLQKMRTVQVNRCMDTKELANACTLSEQVGAAKIQSKFRKLKSQRLSALQAQEDTAN